MKKPLVAAAAAVALAAGAGIGPAQAHDDRQPSVPAVGEITTIAEGLVSPLRLALGKGRTVDVAQSFAGVVSRVTRDGGLQTLDAMDGYFAGSVSRSGGTTYYTMTKGAGGPDPLQNESLLKSIDRHGRINTIANIAEHERMANPDEDVRYGFRDLDQTCLDLQTDPTSPPASYTGRPDSNPYATVAHGHHLLVADAGANAIFSVDRWGNVSTVAVLPAIPVEVTPAIATALGFDPCAIGATYYLEPVPTDLEIGPRGKLYVTSLPGGPEDPSLGAQGSVFAVNSWSGEVERVAGGLVSPTGLAVDRRGNIYVAELFANRISFIPRGGDAASVLLEVNQPAEVELKGNSTLYATTDALGAEGAEPAGKIVSIELNKKRWER